MRLSDVLNLAEKTYTPKGNGVQGKIMSVGPASEKNGWYTQAVTLQGLDNTQAGIEHSSKFPDGMLNQSHIGKDSTWRLKWWRNANQGGKQMLNGYPEVKIEGDGSVTAQPQPAVPYNQPQTPAQPLQATNDKPDWDAIAEGKVRHGVVCAFIQAGKFDVDVSVIDYWVGYIMHGTVNVTEPTSQEVCSSCQLLRVDCTCPTEQFVR